MKRLLRQSIRIISVTNEGRNWKAQSEYPLRQFWGEHIETDISRIEYSSDIVLEIISVFSDKRFKTGKRYEKTISICIIPSSLKTSAPAQAQTVTPESVK